MDSNSIVEYLNKCCDNVIAIYMFGSYETQHQNFESDIDIAVLFDIESKSESNCLLIKECANNLSQQLDRSLDLVNLLEANTVFQYQIITTGKLIYCSNEYKRDVFEMNTMSAYLKLNEERSQIIDEIINTGKVLK
jgi:uncharacterized protein